MIFTIYLLYKYIVKLSEINVKLIIPSIIKLQLVNIFS